MSKHVPCALPCHVPQRYASVPLRDRADGDRGDGERALTTVRRGGRAKHARWHGACNRAADLASRRDRKSVVQGKSGSVRVCLGGSRTINTTKQVQQKVTKNY